MPKRTDLHTVLVLGSGGIVIGQACEFDYSGTQAVRALKAEGYRVILVNSNPATIMTCPELADRTYIEPLTVGVLERIIAEERPDALLPTVGGQTALNLAVDLAESGVLERYGVEFLGADLASIKLAEDRQAFREAMLENDIEVPTSRTVSSLEEAAAFAEEVGYPLIVRPSFTLGGSGGGFAQNLDELSKVCAEGLHLSPVGQVLVEESIAGWKEFELEVVRDRADNFVVVCTIENLDPLGVHTGDSITVAPAMTLTDPEYQKMRNWARQIMEIVGVETGGSNVQFAQNPVDGRLLVIEMNPRVSRSSALASKATGFPIAKVAARLAVGYTLDELPNEITGTTPCSFEPSLDYVVVKIPRWDFAKFPGASSTLGPAMRSVGEVMAIGRTFTEALQKGFRSLEAGVDGLVEQAYPQFLQWSQSDEVLRDQLLPRPERLPRLMELLRQSLSQDPCRDPRQELEGDQGLVSDHGLERLHRLTKIDPWFLDQLALLAEMEAKLKACTGTLEAELLKEAKGLGFSDSRLAELLGTTEEDVVKLRHGLDIRPVFHRVDTCAGEFAATTSYLYSSYRGTRDEAQVSDRTKVIILGSGPNRIGQGIEFDSCCVQASWALAEAGVESIMINCNPETVSTDYDTSDRLYFEPLTFEDVMTVIEMEQSRGQLLGVIVALGGQTPLKLAPRLAEAGVPILGNSWQAIARCEDREQFRALVEQCGLRQPQGAMASDLEEARTLAEEIGYPVLLRPSYVLGGRAMAIVDRPEDLDQFAREALAVSGHNPLLVDRFLVDAVEVDVDCLGDGRQVTLAGILQHIEEAGVHSGDSACVLPTYSVTPEQLQQIREATQKLGQALKLKGLMNVQYALFEGELYVLEVNPRASRTVPFLEKAIGRPLARLATHAMLGRTLTELEFTAEPEVDGVFVKEALLPFRKFPGCEAMLGPEMRSTGEVMGQASSFGEAFAKSQVAAGFGLPTEPGEVLFTVNDRDKPKAVQVARSLHQLGFPLAATPGTAAAFRAADLPVREVPKIGAQSSDILAQALAGHFVLLVMTPLERGSYGDAKTLRWAAIDRDIPLASTTSAALAAVDGIRSLKADSWGVRAVQDFGRVQVVAG